jgi:phage terminase large subunit GpA-like protein
MEVTRAPDHGAGFLLRLLADGLRPDPRRSTAEWAQAERVVAEGAYEGRWRNERTPYLIEPMERASLHCPTRRVTFQGSAQIGKTQLGLNLQGQILAETPAQCLTVLPSINSQRMYNRDKLDRMIQATPVLRRAVADLVERSGAGSTTTVKRGARGAQVEIVNASSSRDLQSRTCRVVILEEISEYEAEVGGRGDPVDQALARTIAWRKRGEKVVDISTPGIKGACRITKLYDQGSGGRFLVPCPDCGHGQELRFAQLHWTPGDPATARYACEGCGSLVEERHKGRMLAEGAWVHDRPDRLALHASYRLNALYSPFTPWTEVAKEAEKAEADPSAQKTFAQQWLGEAWDEAHDLPQAEILLLRRDAYPPGRIPPGCLFLTGATDVQGDRLVWAVYGFDRFFGQWLIETGVLPGDPTRPEVWRAHDALLQRHWTDAWGKPVKPVSWGIDSGYLSTQVYAYCRRFGIDHEPQIRALDGRDGWRLPPLGTPKPRDFDWNGQKISNGVLLWPVGTWDMKSELAGALRLTEQGPGPEGWPRGALRYSEQIDRAWLDELLAEQCVENPRTGARSWKKVGPRNEAWDLAVYTRAQARHATLGWTDAQWESLEARVMGPPEAAQADMVALWAPDLKAQAEAAAKRKAEEARMASQQRPAPAPEERFFDGADEYWS